MTKVAQKSASEITKLWTAYHLSPSNASRLGAVIPTGTYQDMLASARRYPSFVIPVAKSSPPEEPTPSSLPFEMQYLQWDFVKQPAREPRLPDFLNQATTGSTTIPATIVMYTPLAEYKLRQSFAQPTLILTHYTDLADSHGLVLMRGDITPSPSGTPKISTTEAHIMILRLQQFYHPTGPAAYHQDQSVHQKRKLLLHQFHHDPAQFQLAELLKLVDDL